MLGDLAGDTDPCRVEGNGIAHGGQAGARNRRTRRWMLVPHQVFQQMVQRDPVHSVAALATGDPGVMHVRDLVNAASNTLFARMSMCACNAAPTTHYDST
jgi:hypothetical protein